MQHDETNLDFICRQEIVVSGHFALSSGSSRAAVVSRLACGTAASCQNTHDKDQCE